MQPSLLHRLKNKQPHATISSSVSHYQHALTNTLFADLFLLFSSRPILPEENRYPELRSSVLNYGVKIIDNARMGGD
ncbi:hypothetical protein ACGVWS_01855, partial [Enterobacteriaceae bacterium LUAb1]